MTAALYVGDLGLDVTEQDLEMLFSTVGRCQTTIRRDTRTGQSLQYGYVNMVDGLAAQKAIDQLNYHDVKGHLIRVMHAERDPKNRKLGTGNLFVSGLSPSVSQKQLHMHFSTVGPVVSCKIVTDGFGESRGYGYVAMTTQDLAQTSIQRFNGTNFMGSDITVKPFVKAAQRGGGYTNLYIKSLRDGLTESEIESKFAEYGPVNSVLLQSDAQGRPFAFVNFEDAASAEAAVKQLHDKPCEGLSYDKLYVRRAMNKQERERELRQQFQQELELLVGQQQHQQQQGGPPMHNAAAPNRGFPPPMWGQPPQYMNMLPPPPPMDLPFPPFGQSPMPPMQGPGGMPSANHGNQPPSSSTVHFKFFDAEDGNSIRASFAQQGDLKAIDIRREDDGTGFGYAVYAKPTMAVKAIAAMRNKPLTKNSTRVAQLSLANDSAHKLRPANGTGAPGGPTSQPPTWPPQGNMWPSQAMTGFRRPNAQQQQQPPAFPSMMPFGAFQRQPQQQQQQPPRGAFEQRGKPQAPVGSTIPRPEVLSKMSKEDQKTAAANAIFYQIKQLGHNDQLTSKITGMLVNEVDVAELLNLLEAPANLQRAVNEAIGVLNAAKQNLPNAPTPLTNMRN
ncbi:Polyadenylate-binding protein 2 [Diplonema papillatum]|nr:Polyadenylate-binding protein 2 [Diplonema papillatum]